VRSITGEMPILMVTGTVDCALLTDALAAGADDVLYKPVAMPPFSSTP
jgi:CheY-like chemotaxis protein